MELRLAAAYMTSPIFKLTPKEPFPILGIKFPKISDPSFDDLPITNELKSEINEWDLQYQNTFIPNDPPSSKFDNDEKALRHDNIGKDLARKLKHELGESYHVEYMSHLNSAIIEVKSEENW